MNFFRNLPSLQDEEEIFEVVAEAESFKIERIISKNAVSPAHGCYDQALDEWVMVVQGSAVIEMNSNNHELHTGDTLFIPAHTKHKVTFTSSSPVCIWLAVHQKNNNPVNSEN